MVKKDKAGRELTLRPAAEALFPIPENRRNADDMGLPSPIKQAEVYAPDPPLPPLAELVWVTRDKRRYRLREMEARHIRNCIAMILRNPGWREPYLEPLRAELAYRERALR